MWATPVLTAVTTPVPDPIEASGDELHMPPVAPIVSVVDDPMHKVGEPTIGGKELIVTVIRLAHPEPTV
jgi:hypothetical protein